MDRNERMRRFAHPYREDYYLGDDFVIEYREGVGYRTDFTDDLSRLRSLERNILELGYREVSQ